MSSENLRATTITAAGGVNCQADLTRVDEIVPKIRSMNLAELELVLEFTNQAKRDIFQQLETLEAKQKENLNEEIGPVS